MPATLPPFADADLRLASNKIFLRFGLAFRKATSGIGSQRPLDFNGIFVWAAVAIGHGEKRPMSATDLESSTGLSRTTVLRQLSILMARGMVERKANTYRLPAKYANASLIDHCRLAKETYKSLLPLAEKHRKK